MLRTRFTTHREAIIGCFKIRSTHLDDLPIACGAVARLHGRFWSPFTLRLSMAIHGRRAP